MNPLPYLRKFSSVFRLNYPSGNTGGAREGCNGGREAECESTEEAVTGTATKPTTTVGTDAIGPLCDIIWHDQAQRDECVESGE